MVTAFRNRTWIEWAVYAACQLRRLGVATTLVYSSSEVRRLYPLARVAGFDQLGFWAGVEEIPQIRLVDLDDWRPRPDEAAAYRTFARDFAPTVAAYDLRGGGRRGSSSGLRAAMGGRDVLAETGAAMSASSR
jgi:hypothetical protein